MSSKIENVTPVQISRVDETEVTRTDSDALTKKSFVEPEVTFPVDVLEATTFFQAADSGVTLP